MKIQISLHFTLPALPESNYIPACSMQRLEQVNASEQGPNFSAQADGVSQVRNRDMRATGKGVVTWRAGEAQAGTE
ncbi:hypothetical protein [Nevskia soli]|uniref:hypothetical protein n=1 Tax=Nevskia soli TaxID=418856 RepID=UPI0012F909B7|nr:hypothetical protein [Nevskia soli]